MNTIVHLDSAQFDSISKYLSIHNKFKNNNKSIVLVDSSSKMRQQLVQITKLYVSGQQSEAIKAFQTFIFDTVDLCNQLFSANHPIFTDINDLFVEIEWILEDDIMDDYAYYHDQITSIAQLINSKIVTYLLQSNLLDAVWLDVRDLVITDENYQNPNIIDGLTSTNIQNLPKNYDLIVIPNRMGATLNITTTTFDGNGVFEFLERCLLVVDK